MRNYTHILNEGFDSYFKKLNESNSSEVVIHTGLTDNKSKEILESVIGQLSDGIWENNSRMNNYWRFMDVPEDDEALMVIEDIDISGFRGKSEQEIAKWIANKIKQIVKIWAEDNGLDPIRVWDRNNSEDSCNYLNYREDVKVKDAYKVYDALLGRKQRVTESINESRLDEAAPRDLIKGIKNTMHGYRNSGNTRVNWSDDGRAATVDDQLDYENADMEEITPQDVLRMKKNGEDLSDIYVLDDKVYLVKLDATGRADDEGSDWLTSRGNRRNNQSLKTTLANANKIYKGKISTVRETQPEKWQSRTSDPDERRLNKDYLGSDHRRSNSRWNKKDKYVARNYAADSTNPVPKYKEYKSRINDAQATKDRNKQNLDSTRRYIARQIQQLADEKKFVDADNIEQDAKISKNRAEIDNLLNSRRRNKN